ncbi:unnamed protein product [Rhizoctonia solani]|uniref:F-box domain-containing protein n=1 Tax=Rhizoctonia solani TaxID=456999 RepID=A0A8H2XSX1_9AGAM|nr:unnamed protein product [Rhizoctonia solani]
MLTRSASKKQHGASLARSRHPIISLPGELLSEIFVQFVYSPGENYVIDVMLRRIAYIYQRVYTLLAVCTAWRRIGFACPTLWTVVPFVDHEDGRQRPLSPRLSLERAGSKDLHLAMSGWHFSPQRFKALTGHWHRFSVINIWSHGEDATAIHKVLLAIQKHSPPGAISALSLRRKEIVADLFTRYTLSHYEPSISRLICSLAVFRISNFNIDWSRITFSHRLVELRLADMKLRDNSEITAFLKALSSARELKELKLVSVEIDLSQSGVAPAQTPSAISLPKLEFLHLERLYFNVLKFVVSSIAPGSYHLTLNLLEETFLNYFSGSEEPVDDESILTFLGGIKVHKLLLWPQRRFFWWTKDGFHRLLKSVPFMRTLIMNYYPLNLDTLAALKRPPMPTPPQANQFPTLTRLEIHGAFVEIPLAQLKPGLNDVIASHQIQHLVFGGKFVLDKRVPITEPLDENDETFEWMKHKVPHFTKSGEPEKAPATDMWRLWDI